RHGTATAKPARSSTGCGLLFSKRTNFRDSSETRLFFTTRWLYVAFDWAMTRCLSNIVRRRRPAISAISSRVVNFRAEDRSNEPYRRTGTKSTNSVTQGQESRALQVQEATNSFESPELSWVRKLLEQCTQFPSGKKRWRTGSG